MELGLNDSHCLWTHSCSSKCSERISAALSMGPQFPLRCDCTSVTHANANDSACNRSANNSPVTRTHGAQQGLTQAPHKHIPWCPPLPASYGFNEATLHSHPGSDLRTVQTHCLLSTAQSVFWGKERLLLRHKCEVPPMEIRWMIGVQVLVLQEMMDVWGDGARLEEANHCRWLLGLSPGPFHLLPACYMSTLCPMLLLLWSDRSKGYIHISWSFWNHEAQQMISSFNLLCWHW